MFIKLYVKIGLYTWHIDFIVGFAVLLLPHIIYLQQTFYPITIFQHYSNIIIIAVITFEKYMYIIYIICKLYEKYSISFIYSII